MTNQRFVKTTQAAARLGVPAAWLRREAAAGRVPNLRAGRRLLFDVEAVERALSERADKQAQGREAHR